MLNELDENYDDFKFIGNGNPFTTSWIVAELSLFFIIDKILKLILIKLQQYDTPLNNEHWNPVSIMQLESHPSPFSRFPSSHKASITIPSPHV